MAIQRLPKSDVQLASAAAIQTPHLDQDVVIISYAGTGANTAAATPGTLSDVLTTAAAVEGWIGAYSDTDGSYGARWANLLDFGTYAQHTFHVLSLGPIAATPVTIANFRKYLQQINNTDSEFLPDWIAAPGICEGFDSAELGGALASATDATDTDDYQAAVNEFAHDIQRLAILDTATDSPDTAYAWSQHNAAKNTLLCGNPVVDGHGTGPWTYFFPSASVLQGIFKRQLNPEYGRAGGIHYAPVTGISGVKWPLAHDITNLTPTDSDVARLVHADVTVVVKHGGAYELIGGTLGGYTSGADDELMAYLGVTRVFQHLHSIIVRTMRQFKGKLDTPVNLAKIMSALYKATRPLIPHEFHDIRLIPTNFISDGRVTLDGYVGIYVPIVSTVVYIHLQQTVFANIQF